MPIGAKMYEQAEPEGSAAAENTEVKDDADASKDETIEGEVVDDKETKKDEKDK
jgi:hypothetical protein